MQTVLARLNVNDGWALDVTQKRIIQSGWKVSLMSRCRTSWTHNIKKKQWTNTTIASRVETTQVLRRSIIECTQPDLPTKIMTIALWKTYLRMHGGKTKAKMRIGSLMNKSTPSCIRHARSSLLTLRRGTKRYQAWFRQKLLSRCRQLSLSKMNTKFKIQTGYAVKNFSSSPRRKI